MKIGDEYSELSELLYCVAQGSVLGPILFKIYIRSFYSHVAVTEFNFEGFAVRYTATPNFHFNVDKKCNLRFFYHTIGMLREC